APTYLFNRGDERQPVKDHPISPGIPACLGGSLQIESKRLPRCAYLPDKQDFVINDALAASHKALDEAKKANEVMKADAKIAPAKRIESESNFSVVEARHAALLAVIRAERLEDKKDSAEWKQAAMDAATAQRKLALLEA